MTLLIELLPFLMFNDIANKTGQALQFSRALLKYPRVTFLDAIVARLILNGLALLVVNVLVMGFLLLVLEVRAAPDLLVVAGAYALGSLRAARFLKGRQAGLFDMQDVLGLR